MKETPKKYLPVLLVAVGVLLVLFRLIPGSLTLQQIIQRAASPLAGDGELVFSTAGYANLQRAALWLGLVSFALGVLSYLGWRSPRPALQRTTGWVLAGIAILSLLAAANILIARSDSVLYRVAVGSVGATPAPTETSIQPPTPTLDLAGPGRWTVYFENIGQPIAFVPYPGTEDGYLVAQKTGVIRMVEGGEVLESPFLNLQDRVLQDLATYEQGLLGLVFHPDFEENGWIFISYTDLLGHLVISRFQVFDDPRFGDPASEQKILGVFQPGPIHQGGTMMFGPDGYLYIGLGDGMVSEAPNPQAQSLDTPYGKIVRIDVDGAFPYAIPPDNPFAADYGLDEIYVYGLRNPWQFSFDPATGDLYISDVGQNDYEEINFVPAGHPGGINFGWSLREGHKPFAIDLGTAMPGQDLTDPIWVYEHERGNCAVVGGHVYHGEAFPEMQGAFIVGDFCSGIIWSLQRNPVGEWVGKTLFDTVMRITSFAVGHDGELYATDFSGKVWKWVP